MWSCDPGRYQLCTTEYPFSYCTCRKYWFPAFMAAVYRRTDLFHYPLVTLGIVLFSLAVLFQLVTLPVEFNASSRALKMLESTGILGADEKKGARKVLTAAALTYVAALAASILQLLRLIILAGGRDRMISSGVNTRELILEILYRSRRRVSTAILRSGMRFPNISFFRNRNVALLPEYVKEPWNTGSRLIMYRFFFQGVSRQDEAADP